MSRFLTGRRRLAIIGATVGVLAFSGVAYAYFTTTGSGKGTATTGAATVLALHGTSASTLYPGSSSTVSFTVDNPSTGHQQLGTIALASVVACNVAFSGGVCPSGHEVTTCESVETGSSDTNTSNFWMPNVVSNQDVAPGNGQTVTATGSIELNDLSSNQNSCQGDNLQLNFTA